MDRKSRSKPEDKKSKKPLPCAENCANRPELGCRTVATTKYRDFSQYIPQEEKSEEEDPTIQVEEVYFGWLARTKTDVFWYIKFLSDKNKFQPVFQKILDDQCDSLQHSPNYTKILPFGALDSGYIVRYKNPWDFHVILEHQPLYWSDEGHHEKMETWRKYFSADKMSFQSGVDLFRGLTALLSQYMEFRHEDFKEQKMKLDGETVEENKPCYKRGDLVVCVVPRKDDNEMDQWIMLGYRAVVVQNDLRVMTLRGDQFVDGICMRLYFLDTGENRLVEQDSGFVAPLPEVFSIFRPLAIPCALHGISPVGSDWSIKACMEMKRMVLGEQLPSPLLIEFYTNTKAQTTVQKDNLQVTLPVTQEVKYGETSLPWETPTYFVEVTARIDYQSGPSAKRGDDLTEIQLVSLDTQIEEGKRANLTTEMIKQNLGLQWNLFPDRPEIYPYYFDLKFKPVDEAFEDFEYLQGKQLDPLHTRRVSERLERGDLLKIYTEHYKKFPIKVKGDEKIRSQVNVAFILNEDLESQVMTVGKEIDDNNDDEEEDDDDIDVGNNVLSTVFNLDIN